MFAHTLRAACHPQNFQQDSGQQRGGSWWLGTVTQDARLQRPHAEVAADPYGCGGLWQRYQVRRAFAHARVHACMHAACMFGSCTMQLCMCCSCMPRTHNPDVAACRMLQVTFDQEQHQQEGGHDAVAAAAAAAAADGTAAAGSEAGEVAWLSPWELQLAGVSSEQALAQEQAEHLSTELVSRSSGISDAHNNAQPSSALL